MYSRLNPICRTPGPTRSSCAIITMSSCFLYPTCQNPSGVPTRNSLFLSICNHHDHFHTPAAATSLPQAPHSHIARILPDRHRPFSTASYAVAIPRRRDHKLPASSLFSSTIRLNSQAASAGSLNDIGRCIPAHSQFQIFRFLQFCDCRINEQYSIFGNNFGHALLFAVHVPVPGQKSGYLSRHCHPGEPFAFGQSNR